MSDMTRQCAKPRPFVHDGCPPVMVDLDFSSLSFCSRPSFVTPDPVSITMPALHFPMPDIATPMVQCFDMKASGGLGKGPLEADATFEFKGSDCMALSGAKGYRFRVNLQVPCLLSGLPSRIPVYDAGRYAGFVKISWNSGACSVFSVKFIEDVNPQLHAHVAVNPVMILDDPLDVPDIGYDCELAENVEAKLNYVAHDKPADFRISVKDCQIRKLEVDVPVICGLDNLDVLVADVERSDNGGGEWAFLHAVSTVQTFSGLLRHASFAERKVSMYGGGGIDVKAVEVDGRKGFELYGSHACSGPTGTMGPTGPTGTLIVVSHYNDMYLRGKRGDTGPTGTRGDRGMTGTCDDCSCTPIPGTRGPSYKGDCDFEHHDCKFSSNIGWPAIAGIITCDFYGIHNNVLEFRYRMGAYSLYHKGKQIKATYRPGELMYARVTGKDSFSCDFNVTCLTPEAIVVVV